MSTLADFRRYTLLVEAAMPRDYVFVPVAESRAAVQVERGAVFPATLGLADAADPAALVERLIELSTPGVLPALAVVDRAGHRRPVYRPLLAYCWLQAFRASYEVLPRSQFGRWEEALRAWCDLLEATLTNVPVPAQGNVPAALGHVAADAAWSALALHVAGGVFVRDAWTDLAADALGRLARAQTDEGAFLAAGPADNPETRWYHELAVLHAAASYAVQAEDRAAAAAVKRNTEYHLRETQPDHASGRPWAAFAFVWNADARPLADQALHAASVQPAGRGDGVSFLLLADALYCLRLFEKPGKG